MAPLLVAAAHPVLLPPSSPWNVDYAQNSCRLIRTFGEGKTLTKLIFEGDAPESMDMLVIGKPLDTNDREVPARLLPVRGKTFYGNAVRSVQSGDPAIVFSSVRMMPDDVIDKLEKEQKDRQRNPQIRPPALNLANEAGSKAQTLAFADASTEVAIETHHNRPVILQTGSLGGPLRMFQKCVRDSQKSWGVDPDLEDKIVRPAWSLNPTGWLTNEDYPPEMIDRRKESEISVRLLIDASGRVTRCTPLSHYAEVEFGRITCDRITERAHFAPAELADGTKVPSYFTRQIQFRIAY